MLKRTPQGMTLTDAGRALLPRAQETIDAAQAAREAVDAVKGGLQGTVTLGIMQSPNIRPLDLPQLLMEFREAHPAVTVERHPGGSTDIRREMLAGRLLDLSILALPHDLAPDLRLTPLYDEPMLLAIELGDPIASRSSVTLGDLGIGPLVETPASWATRILSDRMFAAAGIERTIAFEVNDAGSLVECIRQGMGPQSHPPDAGGRDGWTRARAGLERHPAFRGIARAAGHPKPERRRHRILNTTAAARPGSIGRGCCPHRGLGNLSRSVGATARGHDFMSRDRRAPHLRSNQPARRR